jgi:choline dehydrogenase-like flavoprotein
MVRLIIISFQSPLLFMPLIDLNNYKDNSLTIPEADIVIIGAGAAGILLAVAFTRKNKKVLVIETGHFYEDDKKQKLNNVQQTGKDVQNAEWGRKRAIGGTTIAWGGQSLPFTKVDFEKRDWVINSGWPISLEELEPYYKRANSFMGIDTLNYSSDIFPHIFYKDPGIDASVFDLHVSKWADEPNFYLHNKSFLDKNVTLFYNAQVTEIAKGEAGIISSITVTNFSKVKFKIPVKKLVIAAGTIESVRLLFTNKLYNKSGSLGRYFMEHPCIEVGKIKPNNPYAIQRYFNTHIWKGRKYSIRLSLNRDFQETNKTLNCSASIMFLPSGEAYDPYAELKFLRKEFKLKRLLRITGSLPSMIKSIHAYFLNRFYYKVNSIVTVSLMMEQQPIANSYITVGEEKDEFGVEQPILNWNITPLSWHTTVTCAHALKQEIERLDLGEVQLYPHIKPETENWSNYLTDVCHHMGGCRMANSSDAGVVDKNLKVWDVQNLYICSQAVFPTSSHSNPTLTMLALGLRLVDHLCENSITDQIV